MGDNLFLEVAGDEFLAAVGTGDLFATFEAHEVGQFQRVLRQWQW